MGATLHVLRKSLLSGAREAEGIAVVIDVLRAFTSAAYMIYLGAEKIVLMADPEEVLRFKAERGALAVGEMVEAVAAFLAGRLGFLEIHQVAAAVMDAAPAGTVTDLDGVLAADAWARQAAAERIARAS